MATVPLINDDAASPKVLAVFDDIRATRNTDYINNVWRALANDPDLLEATWSRLKTVMGPGALDPLVKEMIYVAISAANGCDYCVHSHTASAKDKGMTDAMHGELLSVIGMAMQTNGLLSAMQIPVDEAFQV